MARQRTMLELVAAVAEVAETEAELIATLVYMVNGGHVKLAGSFRGARFELETMAEAA